MFQIQAYPENRKEAYDLLLQQANALFADVNNNIANYANASALLAGFLHNINWVGFYLVHQGELVLGPFQGKPACVKIAFGKGVCGSAYQTQSTIVVPDVHTFPGHIACDEASQSEIVIPIVIHGEVVGVLDIDAPIKHRFDDIDQRHLELFIEVLQQHLIAEH